LDTAGRPIPHRFHLRGIWGGLDCAAVHRRSRRDTVSAMPDDAEATQTILQELFRWLLTQDPSIWSFFLAVVIFLFGLFVLGYCWSRSSSPTIRSDDPSREIGAPHMEMTSGPNQTVSTAQTTAAQLIDEQERRDAFRAAEELLRLADQARIQMEQVTEAILAKPSTVVSLEFKYFVKLAFAGHRARYKDARQKVRDGIRAQSIQMCSDGIGNFNVIYHQEQGLVGRLANSTYTVLATIATYAAWSASEEAYIDYARKMIPVLREVRPDLRTMPQAFKDQDLARMKV